MKREIEIKNRFTGDVIVCGKYESVKECLEKNRNSDLSYSDLRNSDLSNSDLSYSNLSNSNLSYSNLSYSNLSNAKFKEPLFLPDLYSLKGQPPETVLRFWKYLKNGKSPYQHFKYEVDKEYEFDDYSADEQESCAKGGNVATLVWCLKDSSVADEFIEVEFKVSDIVAIPYATDGKFRVKRFKVIRKINRADAVDWLKALMCSE